MSVLIFWIAGSTQSSNAGNYNLPSIEQYYILLVGGGSVLMSHIEESVARYDIKEGGLVKYLLRPVSYYWYHFFTELPWRAGGLVFFSIGFIFLSSIFKFSLPIPSLIFLPLLILSLCLALLLSYTFKMVMALSAFWLTEGWALFEVMEVIVIILAGFLMPVTFYPDWLWQLANILPFAYMIYYPIQAMLGNLDPVGILRVIGIQLIWLLILGGIYRLAWSRGLKTFTGVGT
jgi:ABC-2 type transport system permease protein